MKFDFFKTKIPKSEEKPRQEILLMKKYKSSPQESILESRDFEREGKLLGGQIGDARFVKIRDDGGGVFKPHTHYEDFPDKKRCFIARERAAYLVSRFLGFDFVPPTVIKMVGNKEGSLQEFVEDAQVGHEAKAKDILDGERLKLDIFDDLIGNTDRHGGQLLGQRWPDFCDRSWLYFE